MAGRRRGLLSLISIVIVAAASFAAPATPAAGGPSARDARATRSVPSFFCLDQFQPPGFDLHSFYNQTCGECQSIGADGIASGRWREYRCATFPIGLDVVYPLYIR
jgi:hypothetical protein